MIQMTSVDRPLLGREARAAMQSRKHVHVHCVIYMYMYSRFTFGKIGTSTAYFFTRV